MGGPLDGPRHPLVPSDAPPLDLKPSIVIIFKFDLDQVLLEHTLVKVTEMVLLLVLPPEEKDSVVRNRNCVAIPGAWHISHLLAFEPPQHFEAP